LPEFSLRIEPRISPRKGCVAHEVKRAHALGPMPDPVCCAHCPDHTPSIRCHRYCPAAPRRLSSEGERSPVEPHIAPLVFELKKLGVFYPCWSCEGHCDETGRLWKIPRVWFYADSVVHLRALANAVNRLSNAGRLSTSWRIVLTHSDEDNPDTTFSLEPEPSADSSLDALQSDLRVMADELAGAFWYACDALGTRAG
jgi:hypothetical protein